MNAIEKLQCMFKQNTDPSFWSHNIIESSKLCHNDNDWKHFYAFMLNPQTYNKCEVDVARTMNDLSDDIIDPIKALPDKMVEHVFTNGDETIIHTKNEEKMPEGDDEKTE